MKWIWRAVSLVFFAIVAASVSLLLIPTERLARIATDQLSVQTGRDVSIDGKVGLTFWPVLGVQVEGLQIDAPDWATQAPTVRVEQAAVGVDVFSLLRGEVYITHVDAVNPVVRLEQKTDGRASWIIPAPADTQPDASAPETDAPATAAGTPANAEHDTPASSDPRGFRIDQIRVTNATFIYDAEGSDLIRYDAVDLALEWPDPDGAATITVRVQPVDRPVTVVADIDGFAAFLRGYDQNVAARLSSDAGNMSFEGTAGIESGISGLLAFNTASTDGFFRTLGLGGADLPPGLGRTLALQTGIDATTDGHVSLRGMTADLGGNRFTGSADMTLGDVPYIQTSVSAGALDLRPVFGTPDRDRSTSSSAGAGDTDSTSSVRPKPSSAGPPPEGWSTEKIDASGLAAFNGDIAVDAQSIDLGSFQLGPTRVVLRNTNARMVFELQRMEAYGGTVTGDFVMNNRNGLSVGGRISAADVMIQPVLKDAIDFDRLTGQANMRFAFLGVGETVDAIMNSLSGDGRIDIGKGTILGIDLDRLMRGEAAGGGTTIFDSLNASWAIKEGVLANEDLLLQLKNYEARGAGQVDLGARSMDYTFTPVALRANSGQGLAIPIRLRGPWSDVAILPDIEAALDAQVDEEIDKLESKAKEKIDEKIDDLFEDRQSLEDEVKDRLLRKLFD